MLLSFTIVAAALVVTARAAPPALVTSTRTQCMTSSVSTNPNRPVNTLHYHETVTIAVVVKISSTPTTTITPPPVTQTSTAYTIVTDTTTLDQRTDTFSSTSTAFTIVVATSTSTDVTTITDTSTVTVGASVPATAGFIPVFSGIAAVGGNPSKRKRAEELPQPAPQPDKRASPKKQLGTNTGANAKLLYPKAVLCNTITQIYSTTTKKITYPTKTVTKRPVQKTATSTSTFTVTETTIPYDASTTETYSTTVSLPLTLTTTVPGTTTTTATATSTDPVAAPTYAACQANNIGSYYSSGLGFQYGYTHSSFLSITNAATAQACCIQCVAAGSACGGTVWIIGGGSCYLFGTTGTCDPTAIIGTMEYTNAAVEQIVSNNNCGQFDFASF